MSNKAKTTRGQKVRWLLRHQPIWEGFECPGKTIRDVFKAMQKAKQYSERTHWIDADIVGLISSARKIRRERFLKENT